MRPGAESRTRDAGTFGAPSTAPDAALGAAPPDPEAAEIRAAGGVALTERPAGARTGVDIRPMIGVRLPWWGVRALFVVVTALVAGNALGLGFAFWIAVALALVTGWAPETLVGWVLVGWLIANQVGHGHDIGQPLYGILVGGVHLVVVLLTMVAALPDRGVIALAVFGRPLLRWLVIQIPVQLVAALALPALESRGERAPSGSGWWVAGVAGAVATVVLALIVVLPLLRRRG